MSREIFCQQCQLTYPAWWQNCGVAGCVRQARPKQAPQPSLEQIEIERQMIERKIAAENRQRVMEAVERECQEGLERSGIQVMCERVRQQRSASIRAQADQVHAEIQDGREQRHQKARGGRLDQRLGVLEKEQRSWDQKRAQQLTEAIAVRARRLKARRES